MNKHLLSQPKAVILSKLEVDILTLSEQKTETHIFDLEAELNLSSSQIIKGISKLENRGLAVKEKATRIKLTDEGLKLARDLTSKPTSQLGDFVRIVSIIPR